MALIANLSLVQFVLIVLGYWILAAVLTRAILRRRSRTIGTEQIEWVSDTDYILTFQDTIPIGPFSLIAFGPPLLLAVLWLAL